jgi:acyl-CoA synthetase (AMP-forming)/AMP-acid ligase II
MIPAGLPLHAGDTRPLVIRGTIVFSRGDIHRMADDLLSRLDGRVSRLLLHSDDPTRILAALDAADRGGMDLFIAHTSLNADQIEALSAEQDIQLVLGDKDRWRDTDARQPEGRIYMMTSGTTGAPKVASHSLQSLLARARAGRQPEGSERWLLTYQPTGFAGLQVALTAMVRKGVLISAVERTIAGFYAAARDWQVTHISGTPTFWRAFLMVADAAQLPLEQITLGGEAADQATLDRIRRAFRQARLTHTYASTEAGVVYSVHDGLEGFPAAWLETPPPGVALRIADGFLQIRTANMMAGYASRQKPGQTQPLLADGWLATADRVEVTGDRVRVLGRDDTTINVGGSNVYPLPIEALILRQSGVIEARVYGKANPISGALVCADIVLESGRDQAEMKRAILAACREALAGYQVPRIVNFVEQIAVTAANKKG